MPEWTRRGASGAIQQMSGHSPQRQPFGAPEGAAPPLLVDVVVLSTDALLFEATRDAVGERNPVWRARSAAESVDLLLSGRCGVLLLDLAAVSAEPASLIEQIVEQFPDVVVVAAGRSEDESLLTPLLSDGHVYRFMHKPLTPKRAGMFLNAAIRGHAERRGLRPQHPAFQASGRAHYGSILRKWAFVVAGLACFLVALALMPDGREPEPSGKPASQPAASPGGGAGAAAQGGPRADPVLSRARAALAAGRYESPPGRNALDLYAAVLLARPDHPEARAGLGRSTARVVEIAAREADEGRHPEARRLLQRVIAIDAGHAGALALAQRLEAQSNPPPAAAGPAGAAPSAPTRASTAAPPAAETRTAVPPAAPPATPAWRTRPIVITPDPLAPRIVNAEALRKASARPASGRGFGAPIAADHPIAGLAEATSAPVEPIEPSPAEPVDHVTPATLPAGEFRPLSVVDPVYPPTALRNGTEGWVELEFTITDSGVVRDVLVLGSEPAGVFEAAAREALGQWRFEPRVANGRPVPYRSVVTLRFNVEN